MRLVYDFGLENAHCKSIPLFTIFSLSHNFWRQHYYGEMILNQKLDSLFNNFLRQTIYGDKMLYQTLNYFLNVLYLSSFSLGPFH